MILEVGRNHICLCGSGKKYKKCCLGKEQQDDFKDILLMDEGMPLEAYMDDRQEMATLEDEKTIYYSHYFIEKPELFDAEMRAKLLTDLIACKPKYPHNASILNLLYYFYLTIDQPDLARPYLEEIKTNFPRYIHGRVMCTQDAIDRNAYEEAFSYFNGSDTLKEFDPRRSIFHYDEAAAFHATLIRCYVYKDDEAAMIRHYANLTRVVSMSGSKRHDFYIRKSRELIDNWRFIKIASYFKDMEERERALQRMLTDESLEDMQFAPPQSLEIQKSA